MTLSVRNIAHNYSIYHINSAATFDVHNLSVTVGDDGVLEVTGELITDSRARGCFIVLQGNSSTADVFQIILSRELKVVSGTIIISPHLYFNTIYGYDLEENTLPNSTPAAILSIEAMNFNNSMFHTE